VFFEIATGDFPNQLGPSIRTGTRGVRILRSRDSEFCKVCDLVHQETRIPESRHPDSRVEGRCQGIRPHHGMLTGGKGIGVRGFVMQGNCDR
jgi:hypothetical protein